LNLTEQNPQVSEIIRKNLKDYVMQTKNIPTNNKTIRKFVDTIWEDQLKPFKQEKTEEIL
jgi:spore coat protein CotF